MMGNFFATLSKVSDMGSSTTPTTSASENAYTTTSNEKISSTSNFPFLPSHNLDEAINHMQNISNIVNQNSRFLTATHRGFNSRSSSNTPSPPASSGSVGSIDTALSTDVSSDDNHHEITPQIPRPFWKKRYCKSSNESSTQQIHDKLNHTVLIDGVNGESNDTNNNNPSSIGTEETQENQVKRRKVERCTDNATYIGTANKPGNVGESENPSTHFNEHIHKRKRKSITDHEKPRSNETSHKFLIPLIII